MKPATSFHAFTTSINDVQVDPRSKPQRRVELIEKQQAIMNDSPEPGEGNVDSNLELHNLVAIPDSELLSRNYITAVEFYLDESDDRELNERDSLGRTALHVAVLHRNVEAIAGLLMCGADVNVADHAGKSAFSYCLDDYDMRVYVCNQMFYTFLGHVHKLIQIGLRVSPENQRCYARARERHVFNDRQLQNGYAIELDKMLDVVVGGSARLRDVLLESRAHDLATSVTKRRALEEVVTARDFADEFPKLCCLVKLQYRRAVTRSRLMKPARDTLEVLTGLGLPEPCTENIIRFLDDDDDLANLVRAKQLPDPDE